MRRRRSTSRTIGGGLLAAVLLGALPAGAQSIQDRLVFHPNLQTDLRPTLEHPMRLGARGELKAAEPVWTRSGLWATRPERLWGLAKTEASGQPVWDPSTNAWYAWSMGALVEVKPDGRLSVLLDPMPGWDFDIRAAQGLVVYRDPNKNVIVLRTLGPAGGERILLSGESYFEPRFSPNGRQIVVSDSSTTAGTLWLVTVATGEVRRLGSGHQPSWHPDSQSIFFMRFEDDGYRLTASRLYSHNLASNQRRLLAASKSILMTRPTVSPDGEGIAYYDEASSEVFVARLPNAEGGR